jgi:hypothetical protein
MSFLEIMANLGTLLTNAVRWSGWSPLSSISTAIAALIAAGALTMGVFQYHETQQESKAEQRASLTSLIAELTRDKESEATAQPAQLTAIEHARTADAEEAAAIMTKLAEPAPAVDDYETGIAFEEANENGKAIQLFSLAAGEISAPRYRSAALLKAAGILFSLHYRNASREAEADVESAFHAFDRQHYISASIRSHNKTTAERFDLAYVSYNPCVGEPTGLARTEELIDRDSLSLRSAFRRVEKECS